jgi:hypothetical protein
MALLEEAEIDEWFTLKKEALAERMYDELQRGVASDTAKDRFNKDFVRLLSEYEERFRKTAASRAKRAERRKPFDRLRAWRQERLLAFQLWRKRRAELRQKRKFEREYQRLFAKRK